MALGGSDLGLEDSHEAEEQIAFADVILLNKTDLVPGDELAAVEARIRSINPYAKLHKTERCEIDLNAVLDRGAFDLDRILAVEPDFLGEDHHEHDDAVNSISLQSDRPLDPNLFTRWLQGVTQLQGLDILRLKGILALKGEDHRFVVQGVHMLL